VLVFKAAGFYVFEKLAELKTRVTFQYHMEPAGALPEWLINSLLVDAPFNTLNNLRTMVNIEKYQQAKLLYNAEGIASGFVAH
jgi:hypothetical protein